MTDQQSRRARSLRVIQGFQRSSLEILEDAAHAALYRFLEDEQRWTRMDIEGAAFVTRNAEKPLFSFIILNKLGDQDFILQVQENMLKVKVQDKYLMMQCSGADGSKVVFGLWFHDPDERTRIYDRLANIVSGKISELPGLRKVNLTTLLSPPRPPADAADEKVAVAPPSASKSVQLLSLLKNASGSPPASGVAESSGPAGLNKEASAKLKSVLFAQPANPNNASAPMASTATSAVASGPVSALSSAVSNPQPAPPVAPASAVPAADPQSEMSRKLLDLIKKPSGPATTASAANTTAASASASASVPSRHLSAATGGGAARASQGAELMTDGDIARKLKSSPTMISSTPPSSVSFLSSSPPSKTTAPLPAAGGGAGLSASSLLVQAEESKGAAAGPGVLGSAAKKPSVKLISLSDLL